jgi:hypothetical protein
MKLRIKIFKDGTQKLQYLSMACGKKELWENIPVVFEGGEENKNEDRNIYEEGVRRTIEIKKGQNEYKLPSDIKVGTLVVSASGLLLVPYVASGLSYDYKLINDFVSFSSDFMELMLKDDTDTIEVKISYIKNN